MRTFVVAFLPLLVAYGATLKWCIDRWNGREEYFAHCWLVPLVGAYVVWRKRAEWRARPAAFDRRGLWLLVPGLLLHFAGALLMIDSWSAASLVLTVPGAAWTVLGRERLRGLWPVLGLVLLVVPLPLYVEGRLTFTLKEFAVTWGAWLANVVGAGVVRTSDRLHVGGGSLWVAPACSGLRSLLAMATLAYCLAFFTGGPGLVRRVTLLLLAAPLALLANLLRIAALCLMASWFGVPFTEGTGHTLANVGEWVVLIGTLLLADAWLSRRGERAVPLARDPAGVLQPAAAAAPVPRALAIASWLAAVPLLALSLYRPVTGGTARAERLPAVIAGFTLVQRTPEQEAVFKRDLPLWRAALGTDDFVWRSYRDDGGAFVTVTALFHDANWKSVHPPRICIEGSGMDIEQDELVPAAWLGERAVASRIVARRRSSGQRFVTISLFGTRAWASGDYSQFAWHHLPRAVLRNNESGFLLRVEAVVRGGEPVPEASARATRLAQQLVPMARELLR